MLIIQIALGIVMAVVILVYWREIGIASIYFLAFIIIAALIFALGATLFTYPYESAWFVATIVCVYLLWLSVSFVEKKSGVRSSDLVCALITYAFCGYMIGVALSPGSVSKDVANLDVLATLTSLLIAALPTAYVGYFWIKNHLARKKDSHSN
ncbi:MAG: hypothetical protein ACJAVI_005566 [Candidatus Azotimanducaceae bacterium]|jgi:membrane protein implicated in regulation of membrane protease activity